MTTKNLSFLSAATLASLALSFAPLALAHEHDMFKIGSKQYNFTVGSLNEPIVVDDKTGVDLTVTSGGMPTMSSDGHMDGAPDKSEPVTGLEKTMKVEISAGSEKKVLDLKPAFGKPGSYTAPFYPTVQTAFAYRFFGTIDNVPVDITFSCNPDTSTAQADDTTVLKLSDQVSRISKGGAFGCPMAKADMGFPVPSVANADLSAKVDAASQKSSSSSNTLAIAIAALALSVVSLASGFRKRQ